MTHRLPAYPSATRSGLMDSIWQHKLGITLLVAGTGGSLAFEDAYKTASTIATILVGVGIGLGAALAAVIERTGKAKTAAMKEFEAAFKDTLQAQLKEERRERARLAERVEELTGDVSRLTEWAESVQKADAALRAELVTTAVAFLTREGVVAPAAPTDPPAAAQVTP